MISSGRGNPGHRVNLRRPCVRANVLIWRMTSNFLPVQAHPAECVQDQGVAKASKLAMGELFLLPQTSPEHSGDSHLWSFKRQRQQCDMANASDGNVTQDQLSWFPRGKARDLKLIDSPY